MEGVEGVEGVRRVCGGCVEGVWSMCGVCVECVCRVREGVRVLRGGRQRSGACSRLMVKCEK